MRRLLALCVMTALALPGLAETNVAFYLGGAHTQNSSVTLRNSAANQLTFHNVPFEGRSFESPLYYGGRVGHFFFRHYGIEAEFIHLKMYAKTDTPVLVTGTFAGAPVNAATPMSTYAQRFAISHGNNLLLFNGVYRVDFLREVDSSKLGKLLLTFRVGAGPTIPHAEVTFGGNLYESYFLGKVAIQAGAGVGWRLWRGLYALSEYKFTHNAQRVDVGSRFFKVDANSHHAVFGVGFHF